MSAAAIPTIWISRASASTRWPAIFATAASPGELDLVPKGKSEPFSGVDRSKFSGEALYQLDRRVELRVYR